MNLPDLIACLPNERPIDALLEVGDALLASPLPAVALRAGTGATEAALAEFRGRFGSHLLIGAWSVRTAAEARQALAAGAQFLLCTGQEALGDLVRVADSLPCATPLECRASLALHRAPVALISSHFAAVECAAALRRARSAQGLETALVLLPPLVDLHARPAAFIKAMRMVRRTWELGAQEPRPQGRGAIPCGAAHCLDESG